VLYFRIVSCLFSFSLVFYCFFRYKSFSSNNDNIGDITAKGEAQIAAIDLAGLILGALISKATALSKSKIVPVFLFLTAIDQYCVFKEIRR
jgi:hypothetical protein